MANGKKKTDGWGDDEKKAAEAPAEQPLTNKELIGLRTILQRHGFDREKGTF